MGEAIRIWVDDRERRSSGVSEMLTGSDAVSVVVKRLRTGDYLIEGKAILERKRVRDFLASLKEGCLFAQASQPWRAS
jgi:ERCC4-type nuclease